METLSAEALASLRSGLKAARAQCIASFEATGRVSPLLAGLTRAADQTLRTLWKACHPRPDWALLAIGGYGRRQLQPASDVDLLILIAAPPDAEDRQRLELFIGQCWDAGLEIGQSVRTPRECAEAAQADITVMTSLLERRLLVGDRAVVRALDDAFAQVLDPGDFMRQKLLEMQQRHQKFEDTPYSLEPNVKESPGALRDLHVVLWVARAAGLGLTWTDLVRAGAIERSEATQLRRCERLLTTIRAWLHVRAGRREDRLIFDLQPTVARSMGLGAPVGALASAGMGPAGAVASVPPGNVTERALTDTHAAPAPNPVVSPRALSEGLMQRYYLAAKAITQVTTLLLQSLEVRLIGGLNALVEPLDGSFNRVGNLLDVRAPETMHSDPALILQAFRMLQVHPGLSGMTSRTLRAIWHARRRINGAFRRDPRNRTAFLELLQAEQGVTHELRRMNKWSVLGRYLPTFAAVVGRMQHDLFHVYTVDQHTLMVVRNLRRFTQAQHAHEYPLCSELMAGFERPWVLVVAALFHDIAKGRGGDHSLLGEQDVLRFCKHHGVTGEDRALCGFLVRHHLTMSMTAQKKDLTDPVVIAGFAGLVVDERRLIALYLLTVADIRGTSAKVWNAWKGKLLEDLFHTTRAHLAGRVVPRSEQMSLRRKEAERLLRLRGIDPATFRSVWDTLDVGYFLRHQPEDIAWHSRMLATALREGRDRAHPLVRTRPSTTGEGFEVAIWTPDQPALFARICRYFDARGLSILNAWVHTTGSGQALDTFVVTDPRGRSTYRDVLSLVEVELAERMAQPAEVEALKPAGPARLSRRSRTFPIAPRVDLRPDERGNHYLLVIQATDRPGLLYDIARVLAQAGIDLRGARVSTLGERIEDAFTVGATGLESERGRVALERRLLEVL